MPFLLDTNVISETVRLRPEPGVLAWLAARQPDELFLAAVTFGELVRGAHKVREASRRRRFERWIEHDLTRQFANRILPFDLAAAVLWGRLMGEGDRAGRPRPAAGAQIAAVALSRSLTLVTRNVKDFAGLGVELIDPWVEAG